MIARDTPCTAGNGAGVRTYQFAKALAVVGDLYLVVLNPDSERQLPADLSNICRKIIVAKRGMDSGTKMNSQNSRVRNWLRMVRLLAAPWRCSWTELLRFANSFGVDIYNGGRDRTSSMKMSRRILAELVQWELSLAARFCKPLPLWTFNQWEDFLAVRAEVLDLMDQLQFDLMWFEHSPIYPLVVKLLRGRAKPLIICNTHNIESHLHQRLQKLAKMKLPTGWLRLQPRILERIEKDAFRASDLVVTCSEEDKALALNLASSATVRVAGNGVDTSYFRPMQTRVRALIPTLLFTGVMDYPPNFDAVKHFIEDIFPLIKRKSPKCQFVVAGRNAGHALETLGINDNSVLCVTNPPDMRPQFERAWICVVPLRAGGGTRLKIPEAMAMNCSVVSTRIGAEGVPYIHGEHLFLADQPQEFADAVLRLLSDESTRTQIEKQASQFVQQHYDWALLTEAAMVEVISLIDARMRN